jgi:hypothetical protein
MKKIILILFCIPLIGVGQQLTYVPDDVFEEYIESHIPLADNGIVNDNYVFTEGIDLTSLQNQTNVVSIFGMQISTTSLTLPIINDFTGIEDFKGLSGITLAGLNMITIDLSMAHFEMANSFSSGQEGGISLYNLNSLQNLILPKDSIGLRIDNSNISNIVFHDSTLINKEGLSIRGCHNIQEINISNILGVHSSATLYLKSNSILTHLNLQNGFCDNWFYTYFEANQLLTCTQVDDPSQCFYPAWIWIEQSNDTINYHYSLNCNITNVIDEEKDNKSIFKITNVLGQPIKEKKNTPLFYIFNDGTVERKIILE